MNDKVALTPQAAGMMFDRKIYFDTIKASLFTGGFDQRQVDGQEAILAAWERNPLSDDLRHLAYPLATTYHETSKEMWPIEEYGKGQGMEYGEPDPETGQTYYGRGFVQLTWRENYERATDKLGLEGENDLEWHAEKALDLAIASDIMFQGMWEGWFRTHDDGSPETLERYFNEDCDDPYGAREIINGDKTRVPDWSGGISIGNLCKRYHYDFLHALEMSFVGAEPRPPEPVPPQIVSIAITTPPKVLVEITVNGVEFPLK
jgi:putative chitinase